MKVLSVSEMIAVEKAADAAGHSFQAMMEAAGRGLAEVLHQRFGAEGNQLIVALVGSGNNGGDALVALDYLLGQGWEACALILRQRPDPDPLLERLLEGGGVAIDCTSAGLGPDAVRQLKNAGVVLDGVLGTGFQLPLREPLSLFLPEIKGFLEERSTPAVVVAVDCPSGVDCTTGQAAAGCIPADLTVTMAAWKTGCLQFPAYQYLGEVVLVGIDLPPGLKEWKQIQREIIDRDHVGETLPARPPDSHKGTFGRAVILAGSAEYPGAALLAGKSAYRSGAGLVTMVAPDPVYSNLMKEFPEATWLPNPGREGLTGTVDGALISALEQAEGVLIGPGLGLREGTASFLAEAIRKVGQGRLVVDADGLRLLLSIEDWPRALPSGTILTPHPGEMSALTGIQTSQIQADRIGAAEIWAKRWNQLVLLKGAHTVIAAPDGRTRILLGAEPALARAGSGDVLAGILVGLLAQGLDSFNAAVVGSWLHLQAGKLARSEVGNAASVLAGDISTRIGPAISSLQ